MHKILLHLVLACSFTAAAAQSSGGLQSSGAEVIVPAVGEITQINNEAHATLVVEEQDKDRTLAVSRANRKMRQGIDVLRREDAEAVLTTRGYYTHPVYSDEPAGRPERKRQLIGWRVTQQLELRTTDLERLPRTVAAVQDLMALNGLRFGLSDAAKKKLDQQMIEAAYRQLEERIAVIAKAMGRERNDAMLQQVDLTGKNDFPRPLMMERRASGARHMDEAAPVELPSFEPGDTTVQMHIVGKVRFK